MYPYVRMTRSTLRLHTHIYRAWLEKNRQMSLRSAATAAQVCQLLLVARPRHPFKEVVVRALIADVVVAL